MSEEARGVEHAYFEKDVKYDKSFYENTWRDYVEIIIVLIVFYSIFLLIFWGHMSYAVADSVAAMWTNVGFLIGTTVWILVTCYIGAQTNKLLHRSEFYQEVIGAKEQEIKDQEAKAEQARKQEERVRDRMGHSAFAEAK